MGAPIHFQETKRMGSTNTLRRKNLELTFISPTHTAIHQEHTPIIDRVRQLLILEVRKHARPHLNQL